MKYFVPVLVILFFHFNCTFAIADEYEETRIVELNEFLETQYDRTQPSTPVELLKHWQQIEHIDSLTYYYRENRAVFDRTNFRSHLLHKWADVQISFTMQNHDDPIVSVLANMIHSYKYMLRNRLNGGKSGTYAEIASLVKVAGKKLARLIDKNYADGKVIPEDTNPWAQ